MSQTRIICGRCGFPKIYCQCDHNDLRQPHALKYVPTITTSVTMSEAGQHNMFCMNRGQ